MLSPDTILIVDNDPALPELLSRLQPDGSLVLLTASSGREALHILEQQPVDVLVADLALTDMGGLELIARAKEIQPYFMQSIVLTADSSLETAIEALRLGAVDYLEKPLSPETLWGRIHAILQRMREIKVSSREIQEEARKNILIMDTIQAGVLLIDVASHTIMDANPAACLMIGATKQEICGKVCHSFICPAEKGHCPITDLGQQVDNSERLLLTCRREHLPILKTVVPLYMGGKKYLLESFMDISDRKRVEEELSESRATFHAIIEKSLDGIIIVDTEGDVQFLNQAAADLFNLSRKELLGTQLSFPMSSVEATEINFVHPGRGERIAEIRMAETRWKGKKAYVATLRDITGRKKMEESIRHLADHDALTGLPNRNLFEDRLRQSIRRARRHDNSFALLYVDLDDFKPINDNLGHRAGDMVLQEVARRLRQSIREPDTVARVGGDEFVIILDRINQAENAAQVAGKIIELLTQQPYHLPEKNFLLGASIGISLYPEHGKDMQSLMRCADIAMYTVKEKGKNSFAFYDGRQEEPAAEST